MDNALGLSKLYLDTSLRYSVYQGMYDNGWKGGFSEIPEDNLYNTYALWYNNQDIHPNEESILNNLSLSSLTNLNKYIQQDYVFLDDYKVKLPVYGLSTSKTPEGVLTAKAVPDRDLWTGKTLQNLDKIELEREAGLEEGFGTGYFELYQKGLEKFGDIKEKLSSVKTLLESTGTGTLIKEQEVSYPGVTQLEVFQKALEDAGMPGAVSREDGEAKLRAKINEILRELKDQAGETVMEFEEIVSIAVNSFQPEDCTTQESQRQEDGKTIYTTTMECTFRYVYDLFVKASLTDNSGKKYPVFDRENDETAFKPLTLQFAARECNLDECLKI